MVQARERGSTGRRLQPLIRAEAKLLMVAVCDREPSAAKRAALDPERSPGDLLEVRGSEVYLGFPRARRARS